MFKMLLFLTLLFFNVNTFFAQSNFSFFVNSRKANFDLLHYTVNPDSYAIRMSGVGAKWDNKVGGEMGFLMFESKKLNVSLMSGTYINMHDFDEGQGMSWQLWRGNIGGWLNFEWKPLNDFLGKNAHLIGTLGYAHESQHATDVIGYVNKYMNIPPDFFNNAGIRSFEYTTVKLNYYHAPSLKNWMLDINAGYKYFPEPILQGVSQPFNYSTFFELGIQQKLKNQVYIAAQYYHEHIYNDFVSDFKYKRKRNGETYKFRIGEFGLIYYTKNKQSISLFTKLSFSNGRGLDFLDEVEPTYGGGFRVSL